MILLGTEIDLKKIPRFVRIAVLLLALYWCYALFLLARELVTGDMGRGMGYDQEYRFFFHSVPQLFFVPWIILSVFRRIPIFRTLPGVGFIAIGLILGYQYGSYLVANLFNLSMVGIRSGEEMAIPGLAEIGVVLPLGLLILVTGIMLLVGKPERAWFS